MIVFAVSLGDRYANYLNYDPWGFGPALVLAFIGVGIAWVYHQLWYWALKREIKRERRHRVQ